MITPEEFPYIKSLYVNDCYAYKDFNIELHDYKPFSHLILTGKNGSGKSTILRSIDRNIAIFRLNNMDWLGLYHRTKTVDIDIKAEEREARIVNLKTISHQDVDTLASEYVWSQNTIVIYSYFKAKRIGDVLPVEAPSKETEFINMLGSADSTDFFVKQFKQYLVNKKVYQAFDQLDNNKTQFSESEDFFKRLTESFQSIFEDKNLSLIFVRESFEFFIKLSDGRQLTFDVLSEGFSALLSILMDLFMRVDLIRKQVGDYSYNPCGIVLIDEPETHLHLQLQEQVLPLLTSLFPNIQFIAATHSPAVIASIKNATIFDLTTKESRGSEETVGRSYSDLMRAHFGMNNEYSGIADELFRKVDKILKENKNQPEELKGQLQQFFVENEAYLSPSFRVELESMILENA